MVAIGSVIVQDVGNWRTLCMKSSISFIPAFRLSFMTHVDKSRKDSVAASRRLHSSEDRGPVRREAGSSHSPCSQTC